VVVQPEHLGEGMVRGASPAPRINAPEAEPRALSEQVDAFRRDAIRRALEANDGNWAAAARSLGLHRSNLHHLARRLGLR
jgi:anaerobic nitric oxide reductase transcription regulator